jgi:hypothetical protein
MPVYDRFSGSVPALRRGTSDWVQIYSLVFTGQLSVLLGLDLIQASRGELSRQINDAFELQS